MNEYINLTPENIENEHICCAIGDKKHQAGVDRKKEWLRVKFGDGHVLFLRGRVCFQYDIEC